MIPQDKDQPLTSVDKILNQTPHVFQVGERCQLKELPASTQTQGIILDLIPGKAPAVQVHFDDGQSAELWDTIALQPSQFRPLVLPKQVWKQIPKNYRGKFRFDSSAITYGYFNALYLEGGATTLVIVALIERAHTFYFWGNAFLGLDCCPIAVNKYLLIAYDPGHCLSGDWQVITISIVNNGGIIDAGERQCFRSWQDAYRCYDKKANVNPPTNV